MMKSTIRLSTRGSQDVAATVARAVQAYVMAAGRAPLALHVHPDERDEIMTDAVWGVLKRRGMALCADPDVEPGTVQLQGSRPVRT